MMNPATLAREFIYSFTASPTSRRSRRQKRVEMTRSRTLAKPALSIRNIEICQRVMPGNDVLISSVESGLAGASRPR
jgi:hypothetical protein